MISGVEFFRRKRRIAKCDLASRIGVCDSCLQGLCQTHDVHSSSLDCYIRLSDVLGVPIDALLKLYDERNLEDGDRTQYRRPGLPKNCVAVYRRTKGLTLDLLGKRLHRSKEWARQLCEADEPNLAYVRQLADMEGMTLERFCQLYSPAEDLLFDQKGV